MNSNLHKRLALIESKRHTALRPLIIIYRAKTEISESQQQRINTAKAQGRAVKLIRMTVVGTDGQQVPASKSLTDYVI